jgi:hypothetical protein
MNPNSFLLFAIRISKLQTIDCSTGGSPVLGLSERVRKVGFVDVIASGAKQSFSLKIKRLFRHSVPRNDEFSDTLSNVKTEKLQMKYALAVFAAILLGIIVLSCGSRDERNDIRAQFGEPDAIRRTGVDPFWSETWFYNPSDTTGPGLAFEFRRTSGCGSNRDVYLYASYPFIRSVPGELTQAEIHAREEKATAPERFERPLSPVAPQ